MPRSAHFPALAALAALAGAGCANIGEPPGGPPDSTPPAIIAVRPESGAVVPVLKGAAVVQFDDVVDEMAGGTTAPGGPTGIGRYVLLSPVAGDVKVGWHRSSISVEPREGWKPGRVYHLELLPGIMNLRRVVRKQGQTVVFSTGPAIPTAQLSGTALQWVEQRYLTKGLIRAVPRPDTIAYLAMTDSAGRFHLAAIPPGPYVVYAIQDQNGNRRRDQREAFDSVLVTVDSSASATLWAFVHDTLGPRGRAAESLDSLTFRVTLTEPLDPADSLDATRVRLVMLPDSTPVAVAAVLTPARYDSLAARERAVADSLRRAADTTAKHDTAQGARPAADTAARAGPPPALAAAPRAPAAPGAAAPTAGSPTAAAPAARGGDGGGAGIETAAERLRRKSTPLVRKIAADHQVDISRIPGTGFAGRVTKRDLLGFIESGAAAAPVPATRYPAPAAVEHPAAEPWPGDRVEPWSKIRKITADHMVLSRRVSAHVASFFEVDFSRVAQLRAKAKASYAERGVNLTFLAFIAKACAENLRTHEVINAAVAGDATIYRRDINIGVAVALEWGLIVPVIRHADELSLMGIARAINDLGERARTKRLSPDDIQRGTFTITNPGGFGPYAGIPIINQPQVAILGVGAIEKRPKVVTQADGSDAIAVRTMGMLTMSYDHRIVDGADADRFLADVKKLLQEFPEGAV